jgi:hypothetical protein
VEDTPKPKKPMSERLDMFPEAWMPEPEDLLIGNVTDVDDREGDYGVYPIVCVLPDNGDAERAVHGFHTVLKREFAKQKPAVGNHIGIKYHGKVEGRNGFYESYRVIVEKPDQPAATSGPDWDRHAKDAKAELEGKPPLPSDEQPPDDDGAPW